jgi:hypothetical protein
LSLLALCAFFLPSRRGQGNPGGRSHVLIDHRPSPCAACQGRGDEPGGAGHQPVLPVDGAEVDGRGEKLRARARLLRRRRGHWWRRRQRRGDADALRHRQGHHLRLRHDRAGQHEQDVLPAGAERLEQDDGVPALLLRAQPRHRLRGPQHEVRGARSRALSGCRMDVDTPAR